MDGISVDEFCANYPYFKALFDGGAVDRISNFRLCAPELYYGTILLAVGALTIAMIFMLHKKYR